MPARDKTEASVDVACVTRGMPDLQRLDDSYFAFVSTEKLYPRSVARGSNIERFRNRSSTQWIRLLTMFTGRRAVVLQIVFINLLVSDSGRIFERVHSTLKQWKEDGRFVWRICPRSMTVKIECLADSNQLWRERWRSFPRVYVFLFFQKLRDSRRRAARRWVKTKIPG